jgi:hypothetical protein
MSTSHSPATHPSTAAVTTVGRPPRSAIAPGTKSVVPYHRLARAHPSYRWWRPVLTLLVTAVTWSLLLIALVVTAMVASALHPALGVRIDAAMDPSAPLDIHDPLAALLALGLLALGLPAALLGVRVGGWRPAGSVSSVIGRVRWALLIRCLGLAVALHLVINLVLFATGAEGSPMAPNWGPHSGWALAVALLWCLSRPPPRNTCSGECSCR